MTSKNNIQKYINNFRRRLTPLLKPGIGLACNIYPAETGGAVLEFTIAPEIENDDIYKQTSPSLGRALSNIEQRAFGGNLDGFSFGGTNVILEGNRIIFIKEDSAAEWSDNAAQNDVSRVLSKPKGRA
jgi:hypothetical protein